MVCPKCGSPVSGDGETCSNCGAELDRTVDSLDDKSEGLREMTQKLKAVGNGAGKSSVGETIADRFEIDEFVDSGPFGEVYRAHDEIIETNVALKLFDDEVLQAAPDREKFLDATHAARSMTQRNVVRVHDSGVHEGHPWVSMQYLEGLTLEKVLELREKKGERFTLEELEPVITQITLALQHIGREFPNGDLKPTNVFFLPDLVKITDGYMLSAIPGKIFTERLADNTYLAPELRSSTENADVRCDVYSLGAIVGEMYFGPDYVPGDESVSGPESEAIDVLCQRATAFDPAERYPTVEALSEDFATLVDTGQLLDRASALSPSSVAEPSAAGDSGQRPDPGTPNAEFPEDEVATRDYERSDPGPGPAGPTNEVDRDNYPPPDAVPGAELPPEPESPPGAVSRPESAGSGESSSRFGVYAFVILLGVAGGLVVWALTSSEKGDDPIDISDQESEESAVASGEDESDGGAGASQGDSQALVEGIEAMIDVNRAALEAARERAESEAEDRDEGEESGTTASTKSGRAGSAEQARGTGGTTGRPADDEAAGAAATQSGGEAAGDDEPEPARGTDCPERMALVERDAGNYCIDRYEYPGPGQKPKANVTWFEAKSTCKSEGKRLCTLAEFRRACGTSYPWGDEWDASKCNTSDESGFARSIAPAGEFKECRSWPGTYDMVGNVLEWVEEQKIVGGGFDSGKDVAKCGYASNKSPGSAGGSVGFRCCARPE